MQAGATGVTPGATWNVHYGHLKMSRLFYICVCSQYFDVQWRPFLACLIQSAGTELAVWTVGSYPVFTYNKTDFL